MLKHDAPLTICLAHYGRVIIEIQCDISGYQGLMVCIWMTPPKDLCSHGGLPFGGELLQFVTYSWFKAEIMGLSATPALVLVSYI